MFDSGARFGPGCPRTPRWSKSLYEFALAGHYPVARTRREARTAGWLPFLNAYRTMCMAPDEALLAVMAGVWQMQLSEQSAGT